ncbi:MAG: hypothetical protein ACE5GB_02535 [Acidimicrobiales bacterium]
MSETIRTGSTTPISEAVENITNSYLSVTADLGAAWRHGIERAGRVDSGAADAIRSAIEIALAGARGSAELMRAGLDALALVGFDPDSPTTIMGVTSFWPASEPGLDLSGWVLRPTGWRVGARSLPDHRMALSLGSPREATPTLGDLPIDWDGNLAVVIEAHSIDPSAPASGYIEAVDADGFPVTHRGMPVRIPSSPAMTIVAR